MLRMAILAPLRHRPFRLLYGGQLVSDLGDWLDFLALITLIVYRWELGAGALAALTVTMVLPFVVVGPVAGVWADRWPRRTVMIAADLARAAVVLGLVWAPNLPSLLALVGAKVMFSTFFSPARQAAIRSTVPDEDLLAANSLSQLSLQGTKVLGPVLGGVVVAAMGPRAAFALDSVTFLVSAVILSRLPLLSVVVARGAGGGDAEAEGTQPGFWQELRAGFAYIFHRRVLAAAVVSMTAAMFLIFTFDSLGALALNELGVGESLLGLAVGSIGLGTAVGAVVVGQWGRRFHPLAIIGAGELAGGVLVALIGAAAMLSITGIGVGWIPVWLAVGLTGAAMFVPYGYVLQRETPEELIGRVAATANALQTIFQLAAPVVGAVLARGLGVGFVFALAGAALALLGAGVLLMLPSLHAAAAEDSNLRTYTA